MLRRRVGHDYESRRIYLITMTVEGRRPLLGKLVGDAEAMDGSPEAPRIELSPLGKKVEECWKAITRYYPEVRVLAITIMPDHLHGILFVERRMDEHLGMVIKGFKTGCNKVYRSWLLSQVHQPCTSMPQQCCRKDDDRTHGFLFSRNYNDHILDSPDELKRWFAYLKDNPNSLRLSDM